MTTPPGGKTRAFLARKFFLGAVDPVTGQTDPEAWRRMGYDFDGVATTPELAAQEHPGTCSRNKGSNAASLVDGDEGRDNNLGSELLRIYSGLAGGRDALERDINASYPAPPAQTFVVVIDDVGDGPDDSEVRVQIMYTARSETKLSLWDGSEHVPIDGRSVIPGTAQARLSYAKGYVAGHTVVNGDFGAPPQGEFFIPLGANGLAPIALRTVTLALELDPTHEQIVGSTLAGVIPMADLVKALVTTARLNGGFECGPAGEKKLFTLLRPIADLSANLPGFLDPSGDSLCDAVSFGWRVDWSPIAVPTLDDVVESTPLPDPCAEPAAP